MDVETRVVGQSVSVFLLCSVPLFTAPPLPLLLSEFKVSHRVAEERRALSIKTV